MKKMQLTGRGSKNWISKSKNKDNGNSKASSLRAALKLKSDRLKNGKQGQAGLRKKL